MANFFKRLFGKKKKITEVENVIPEVEQKEEKPEVSVQDVKLVLNDESVAELKNSVLHERNIAEYNEAIEIAKKIQGMSEYASLGIQFENYLSELDKNTFQKKNLENFLKSAENIVASEGERLSNLNAELMETQKTLYAILDVGRMEEMIDKNIGDMPKLDENLYGILEKIKPLEDSDILQINDEFKKSYEYVKNIAYMFNFIDERIDYLLDRDSEAGSVKFYDSKYSDYNSVYNHILTKLDMLDKLNDKLTATLNSYTKRIKRSRGNGIINIDWDNKNYNALLRMKNELMDGYAKLEKDCISSKKNIKSVSENLINSSKETISYLEILQPKLKSNNEVLKSQKANVTAKVDAQTKSVDNIKAQLSEMIKMFNTLYVDDGGGN